MLEAVPAIDQLWEVSFPSLKLVRVSLITSPQVLIVRAKKNFKKLHPNQRTLFSCIPMQKFHQLGMSIKVTN